MNSYVHYVDILLSFRFMVVKKCHVCKGRKGRWLNPKPKGRWIPKARHRFLNRSMFVECNVCHGDGELKYPTN